MIRYDIYDQQLNPGDYICWCTRNTICYGKIHSITPKGILRVHGWSDERQIFRPQLMKVRAIQIIKVTGIPVKPNQS